MRRAVVLVCAVLALTSCSQSTPLPTETLTVVHDTTMAMESKYPACVGKVEWSEYVASCAVGGHLYLAYPTTPAHSAETFEAARTLNPTGRVWLEAPFVWVEQ
jgi:hypothetical protein